MQVHHSLPTEKMLDGAVLTVGTFDGVHRGHQILVSELKNEAQKLGVAACALTFVDMPWCYFNAAECPKLLTLAWEKIDAFRQSGLDHLFIIPFSREIAGADARDFMALWREKIGLKLFLGGPDFALGKNRAGTIQQLGEIGRELGFEARALKGKLLENGAPISSTRVRGVLEAGQVELAQTLLGRAYKLSGEVVTGDQLGRKIGVPTINFLPNERKCLPNHGVYAIRARLDGGEPLRAALNLGMRPTVGGLKRQIEFHVLDQTIEMAPQTVDVEFVAKLRDERKFDGLEALVSQMKLDFEAAREVL